MKHAFRAIGLCVLGGAAVTVAIALACARWSAVGGAPSKPPLELPYELVDRAFHGFGIEIGIVYTDWLHKVQLRLSSGWPCPALVHPSWKVREIFPDLDQQAYLEFAEFVHALPPDADPDAPLVRFFSDSARTDQLENLGAFLTSLFRAVSAAESAAKATPRAALPVRPLWGGFVLDTVFHAAIVWLLACGPCALRRALRVRRGLCARCAYPVGQSLRCTECGWETRRRQPSR